MTMKKADHQTNVMWKYFYHFLIVIGNGDEAFEYVGLKFCGFKIKSQVMHFKCISGRECVFKWSFSGDMSC